MSQPGAFQPEKTLVLFCGLPGSGKSTLADALCERHYCADDFMPTPFDPSKLEEAHRQCREATEIALQAGAQRVGVHNTFTREWERAPYFELAHRYRYRIHVVAVMNYHGSKSIHNVPAQTIEKMRARFEVKL